MLRVLIIEDDKDTSDLIKKGLLQEGYSVDVESDGLSGLGAAKERAFDAIVIDIMLPGIDGLQVVKLLRADSFETPVLILSAKSAINDRIRGLRLGGDDYMVKPFSFSELVARLEALVRRSTRMELSGELTSGEITVDPDRFLAQVNGALLDLQPGELKLLIYLMRNRGRVVSKTMILDYVWGYSFHPQTNVVEAKMSTLRSKIAAHTSRRWITTVRGLGYRFEEAG